MDTKTAIREIRFNLEDEQLTECYVFIDAWNDVPIGVIGWHHKTFPARMSVVDILQSDEFINNHLMWPLEAPSQ